FGLRFNGQLDFAFTTGKVVSDIEDGRVVVQALTNSPCGRSHLVKISSGQLDINRLLICRASVGDHYQVADPGDLANSLSPSLGQLRSRNGSGFGFAQLQQVDGRVGVTLHENRLVFERVG